MKIDLLPPVQSHLQTTGIPSKSIKNDSDKDDAGGTSKNVTNDADADDAKKTSAAAPSIPGLGGIVNTKV